MPEIRDNGDAKWPGWLAEFTPGGLFACKAHWLYERSSRAREFGFSPMPEIRALADVWKDPGPPCPPQGCRLCVRPWMGKKND